MTKQPITITHRFQVSKGKVLQKEDILFYQVLDVRHIFPKSYCPAIFTVFPGIFDLFQPFSAEFGYL